MRLVYVLNMSSSINKNVHLLLLPVLLLLLLVHIISVCPKVSFSFQFYVSLYIHLIGFQT